MYSSKSIIELLPRTLRVNWNRFPAASSQSWLNSHINRQSSEYHYLWLRDNCQCPQCLHPSTRQKLHSSADIIQHLQHYSSLDLEHNILPRPLHVRLDQPLNPRQLIIDWQEKNGREKRNHSSIFDIDWLRQWDGSKEFVRNRSLLNNPFKCWDQKRISAVDLDVDFKELTIRGPKSPGFLKTLENLQQYGLAFVTGIPQAKSENQAQQLEQPRMNGIQSLSCSPVENIAQQFGPIFETFYGRTFDVKSVPNANNIAYTSLFLDLHMDLMYFEAPPGLQFLHCIESSVRGGESIFMDSYAAVEQLKTEYPKDFEILTEIPVTFYYKNNGHHLHFRRPTISVDDINHQPYQVYFAPPFQGPLEIEVDRIEPFYMAFHRFSQLIQRSSMRFTRRLEPGQCVIFSNRRVLHGRMEFDGNSGNRYLMGTYVAEDAFKDCYRVNIGKDK